MNIRHRMTRSLTGPTWTVEALLPEWLKNQLFPCGGVSEDVTVSEARSVKGYKLEIRGYKFEIDGYKMRWQY